MADVFQVDLVSPERMLSSGEAEMVQIPGMMGDLTAMPQHAPFLTTLRPGIVAIHSGGQATEYFVTGGFAEISPDGASVLAEEAVERDKVERGWLDERVEAADAAAEQAPTETKAAADLRANDFRTARDQLDA